MKTLWEKYNNQIKKSYYMLRIIIGILFGLLYIYMIIGKDIIIVVPIIVFAFIDLILEFFTDREFVNGFRYFDDLAIKSHKLPRKLWKVSKKIIYLLLLNILSFSFVSKYLEASNVNSGVVLFKGAIFVGGLSALFVAVSVAYKELINPNFSSIKNNEYGYKIEIPSNWGIIRTNEHSESLHSIEYGDPFFINKICAVLVEDKNDYEDSAHISDFCQFQDDLIEYNEDIELKSIKIINKTEESISIQSKITINKKKYDMYRYLVNAKNYFYEVRYLTVESSYKQEECIKIIESFDIL